MEHHIQAISWNMEGTSYKACELVRLMVRQGYNLIALQNVDLPGHDELWQGCGGGGVDKSTEIERIISQNIWAVSGFNVNVKILMRDNNGRNSLCFISTKPITSMILYGPFNQPILGTCLYDHYFFTTIFYEDTTAAIDTTSSGTQFDWFFNDSSNSNSSTISTCSMPPSQQEDDVVVIEDSDSSTDSLTDDVDDDDDDDDDAIPQMCIVKFLYNYMLKKYNMTFKSWLLMGDFCCSSKHLVNAIAKDDELSQHLHVISQSVPTFKNKVHDFGVAFYNKRVCLYQNQYFTEFAQFLYADRIPMKFLFPFPQRLPLTSNDVSNMTRTIATWNMHGVSKNHLYDAVKIMSNRCVQHNIHEPINKMFDIIALQNINTHDHQDPHTMYINAHDHKSLIEQHHLMYETKPTEEVASRPLLLTPNIEKLTIDNVDHVSLKDYPVGHNCKRIVSRCDNTLQSRTINVVKYFMPTSKRLPDKRVICFISYIHGKIILLKTYRDNVPIMGLRVGDVIFFTFSARSRLNAARTTKRVYDYVMKEQQIRKTRIIWFLMGDFKCSPDSFIEVFEITYGQHDAIQTFHQNQPSCSNGFNNQYCVVSRDNPIYTWTLQHAWVLSSRHAPMHYIKPPMGRSNTKKDTFKQKMIKRKLLQQDPLLDSDSSSSSPMTDSIITNKKMIISWA